MLYSVRDDHDTVEDFFELVIYFAIARVDQGVIYNDDVVAFNSGDFFRCKKLSSIFCRKFMS